MTVSAAISVKNALDEVRQLYLEQNPGVRVAINYGASGTPELQIEQGAPVDLYISAAPKAMDALGEPRTVPAGQYAEEVLTSLGIYDAVRAKAIWAKDVRQVLTYVETENVDAGIVYSTDALSSPKAKIVAEAPETSHAPVVYPVAVLKSSKNPVAAKQFALFLLSPEGGAIFRKHGFGLATP